jgi:hypothetical protein
MNICSRARAGMVFPGDEGMNYAFNPGEGFAEAYRVLIETNGTAVGYDWPIVDPSFRPDVEALAAIRADVFQPWTGPSTTAIRGKPHLVHAARVAARRQRSDCSHRPGWRSRRRRAALR